MRVRAWASGRWAPTLSGSEPPASRGDSTPRSDLSWPERFNRMGPPGPQHARELKVKRKTHGERDRGERISDLDLASIPQTFHFRPRELPIIKDFYNERLVATLAFLSCHQQVSAGPNLPARLPKLKSKISPRRHGENQVNCQNRRNCQNCQN